MNVKKNILVAPLNWGIGHATRCIPIINKLIEHNYNVIIASSGRSLDLLIKEFPKNDFIKITDYDVNYFSFLPLSFSIFLQIPKILMRIKKEKNELKKIIEDFNIDGVISDNRFGFYSKTKKSVFITHQLEIQSPYFKNLIQKINYSYINKFSQCWILDHKEPSLAGLLSNPKKETKNQKYIGPQSRFEKKEAKINYDILAIVSGPEPQRTIFENILIKELKKLNKKSLLVQGKPEINNKKTDKNLNVISHLSSEELNKAILESKLIICRSGYSTIMDLYKLEKNAILVPTPGQTEQEYLANHLSKNDSFKTQIQNRFSIEKAINQAKSFKKIKNYETKFDWHNLFEIFEK